MGKYTDMIAAENVTPRNQEQPLGHCAKYEGVLCGGANKIAPEVSANALKAHSFTSGHSII